MLFPKFFLELSDKFSYEVWIEISQTNNNSYPYALSFAVKSWCRKLNLSNEVAADINMLQQNDFQEFTSDAITDWRRKFFNADSDFKKYITTKVGKKMNRNIDDVKFIVLVAFIVVGLGYALYLLKQQDPEKRQVRNNQSSFPQLHRLTKENNSWILVVVINAEKEDILQLLKNNRKFTPNDCKELYSATQSLWMGSEVDFSDKLEKWFSSKNYVPDDESSEYDVYLVQIHLKEPEPGFKSNVTSIERLDAFLRLPENSVGVKVSLRLPCTAYEKTVYSR